MLHVFILDLEGKVFRATLAKATNYRQRPEYHLRALFYSLKADTCCCTLSKERTFSEQHSRVEKPFIGLDFVKVTELLWDRIQRCMYKFMQ